MSIKLDGLAWSPNREDEFVTVGTDITLYKIQHGKDKIGQAEKISDDTYAVLQSVNSEIPYIKCIAWYPGKDPGQLIAVGTANGRVILTSFGQGGSRDPNGLVGKEFGPRHARQCNHLAWSRMENNLLAQGLDKYRADASVLVWDVNARPNFDLTATPERTRTNFSGGERESHMHMKPLIEIGASESVYSLCWDPHKAKHLVTGINKYLRIYDIRDTSHPSNAAVTKTVHGVCVDPFSEHRLASFADNHVSVWDLRHFDKPVLTFQEPRNILKIAWCPTRFGLLGSLIKDTTVVKLYDILHTAMGSDELEPVVLERFVQPFGQHAVTSFTWHPTSENRMLTASPTGKMRDMKMFERISLCWSPSQSVTWSCGRKLFHSQPARTSEDDDIANKMRRRALYGYGLQLKHVAQSLDASDSDLPLQSLWTWIGLVKDLRDAGHMKTPTKHHASKFYGVKSVIQGELNPGGVCNMSDVNYASWEGMDKQDRNSRLQPKLYKSEERSRCLQLCGWCFENDNDLNTTIEHLEMDSNYERAALIALFNLKIKKALQVLNRGAVKSGSGTKAGDINLNVVAMALSGFTDDKNTLWREMCGSLRTQIGDPNLRAMFAFLTSNLDNYDEVLSETDVCVQDRVAFACMYLSDARLSEYITSLASKLTDSGQLEGVLLTGLSTDGLELLQNYVDRTGDVQTASLAVMQALPNEQLGKDARVVNWIESYRNLLDRWGLWHERAEFDVHRSQCDSSVRPAQQVYVSCNFCGKSVSGLTSVRRTHFLYGAGPAANKSKRGGLSRSPRPFYEMPAGMHYDKISSCPGCRKPLPRCALCLINMGTGSGTSKQRLMMKEQPVEKKVENILAPFCDWFTWCQSCRHGGHAQHITQWFSEHTECPVTGCSCKCMTLDSKCQTLPSNSEQTTKL